MAEKMTLTVTMSVSYNGGPKSADYDYLAEHVAEEWDGMEIYFQDPEKEEETSVRLSVDRAVVTTA